MKTEWRVFGVVAAFLFVVFVVYAFWTRAELGAVDWIGSTALILSGLLCGMCAGYFWFVSRRIDLRPEDRADAEMAEGAGEIARRARGTPRIANRLLRRVRDFAEVKAGGTITVAVAAAALDMLKVDAEGFDALDRRLLTTIIENFDGGPVGVESLAAALSEERGTIEDVIEPFLIQQGYLVRTARGRMVTARTWRHFGLEPPRGAQRPGELFGAADE